MPAGVAAGICCPLDLLGPLVLPPFLGGPAGFVPCVLLSTGFATVFVWPAGFATSCLLPHWFCGMFVCWPAGFATDFGNIEQRQDLIILAFTLTLYPLRHGRARGGELSRREAAALAAATPAVFLVFGAMWVRCWCLRAYKCTMLGLSGTTVGLS